MTKFRPFLAFIALGFLLHGSQEIYTYLQNPEPAEMTCQEFVNNKPKNTWLKLTECQLDIGDSTYIYFGDEDVANELYIPAYPVEEFAEDKKVKILIYTQKQRYLNIYNKLIKLPEEEILDYQVENFTEIAPITTIEGTVKFGLDDVSSDEKQDIIDLNSNLAEDIIFIELDKKPDIKTGIGMTSVGLIFLVAFVYPFIANRKKKDDLADLASSNDSPAVK
jgi:hypothetical protein